METAEQGKKIDIHNTQIQLLGQILELENPDNASKAFAIIHGIKDIDSLIQALDQLIEFLPAESLQRFKDDIEELLLDKDFPLDSLKRRLAISLIRTTVRDKVLQYLKPLTEDEVSRGIMVVVSAIELSTGITFEPEALTRLSDGLISAESWSKRTPEFATLSKDLVELHAKKPGKATSNLIQIIRPQHDISGLCRTAFNNISVKCGESIQAAGKSDTAQDTTADSAAAAPGSSSSTTSATSTLDTSTNDTTSTPDDDSSTPDPSPSTKSPDAPESTDKKHERSFIQEALFTTSEKSAKRFRNSTPEEQEKMTKELIHQFTNARSQKNLILFCIMGAIIDELDIKIEPPLTEDELMGIYKHNVLMKADLRGIGRFLKLISQTLKTSPAYGEKESDLRTKWKVQDKDRPKILTDEEKKIIDRLKKIFEKHPAGKKIAPAATMTVAKTPENLLLAALLEFFEDPAKIELVERVLQMLEENMQSVSLKDVLDKAIPAFIHEPTIDHTKIQSLRKICELTENLGKEIYERTGRALIKYRGGQFLELSAQRILNLEAIEVTLPLRKFLPTQISFKEAQTRKGTEEIIRQFISAIRDAKTSEEKITIAERGAESMESLRNHLIKNGKIFAAFYETCRKIEQLSTTPEDKSAAKLLNQNLRSELFPDLIFTPDDNKKGFKLIGSSKEHSETRTDLESLKDEHSKQLFLNLADKKYDDAILEIFFICCGEAAELKAVSRILKKMLDENIVDLIQLQETLQISGIGQGGTNDSLKMVSEEEANRIKEFLKEMGLTT